MAIVDKWMLRGIKTENWWEETYNGTCNPCTEHGYDIPND